MLWLKMCVFTIGWFMLTQLGCVHYRVVGSEVKSEQKRSEYFVNEQQVKISLGNTKRFQRRDSKGMVTSVNYIGEYTKELAQCLGRTPGAPGFDDQNPRHVFLFEIKNDGEQLRKFTPYMDFPTNDLKQSMASIGAGTDCSIVMDFLPITQVRVVEGERTALQCSQPSGGGPASFIASGAASSTMKERTYELFPKQARRGMMIASQPPGPDGVTSDPLQGNFHVYVHETDGGLNSHLTTIPYTFARYSMGAQIRHERVRTRQFGVNLVQKYVYVLIFGFEEGDEFEERIEGSEINLGDTCFRCQSPGYCNQEVQCSAGF